MLRSLSNEQWGYSSAAHLVVPAGVSLHITPRNTHWGDTIRISGVVNGGYIPPKGEIVLVIAGAPSGAAAAADLDVPRDAVRRLVEAGAKPRVAARVVAELTGASANELYRAVSGS